MRAGTRISSAVAAVVAAASLLSGAGGARASSGFYAEYRDWAVACDNVRTCRAIGFRNAEASGAALFVDRAGDVSARPTVQILVPAPGGVAEAQGGGLELVADGVSLGIVRAGRELHPDSHPGDDGWIGTVDDQALVLSLLKAFRTSRSPVMRRPGGKPIASVSLEGAAAALLAMDEGQARLGTRGALVRVGGRPDSEVPPRPEMPVKPPPRRLTSLPPATAPPPAVRRLAEEDVTAERCEQGAAERGVPTVARLSDTAVLFGLPCRIGYRADVTAFYLSREEAEPGTAERLSLPRPRLPPGDPDPESGHILVGDGLDPETGDIGDMSMDYSPECGTYGHWRWTGTAFSLTSYGRTPSACRGLGDTGSLVIHRSAGE